jgi:flagellar protein FliS
MLYEGALISLRIARRGIEEKKPKLKGEKISKVLAILTELDCALDRQNGGDLSEKMSALYGYMMNRLTTANIKNDPEPLKEVEQLLGELYEGFKQITGQDVLPAYTNSAESEMTGGVSLAI